MKSPEAGSPLTAGNAGDDYGSASADTPAWEERHARRQARSAQRVRVIPKERFTKEGMSHTARVHDAAAFLVRIPKPLSWLKLQDLLYFAQAWHLVWDEELLFPEDIIATPEGISIPEIDRRLSGSFEVKPGQLRKGRPDRLTESQQQTLSGIVKFYAGRSHYRLNELIIAAAPWQAARAAADGSAPARIEPVELHRHYRSLE